jgi:hypothetical protein
MFETAEEPQELIIVQETPERGSSTNVPLV